MKFLDFFKIREENQTQESFNKFMVDQINSLEGFFRNELKKTKIQLESERDNRTRLEANLKYSEEQVIIPIFY